MNRYLLTGFLILLLALNAFAGDSNSFSGSEAQFVSVDFGPLLNGIVGLFAGLPDAIVQAVFGFISGLIAEFVKPLLNIVKVFLLHSVDVFKYSSYWFSIVGIISLFYVLLFFLTGLKFLAGSYDAEQRASAKEWLKNVLVILVVVNTSLLWYGLMAGLSSGVAGALWSDGLERVLNVDLSPLNLVWLFFLVLSVVPAVITLFFRQLVVIMGVMLFPIGLFLYFVEPLRAYGLFLLNLIGIALLMPIVDVILLIAVNLMASEFAGIELIGVLSMAVSLVLLALLNLGLFYFAVFKSAMAVPDRIRQIVHVIRGGE